MWEMHTLYQLCKFNKVRQDFQYYLISYLLQNQPDPAHNSVDNFNLRISNIAMCVVYNETGEFDMLWGTINCTVDKQGTTNRLTT